MVETGTRRSDVNGLVCLSALTSVYAQKIKPVDSAMRTLSTRVVGASGSRNATIAAVAMPMFRNSSHPEISTLVWPKQAHAKRSPRISESPIGTAKIASSAEHGIKKRFAH